MCILICSHLAQREIDAELHRLFGPLEVHHRLESEREELHVVRVDTHCLAVHSYKTVQTAATELSAEAKRCLEVVHLVSFEFSAYLKSARWSSYESNAKLLEWMQRVVLANQCVFVLIEVDLCTVAEHAHVILHQSQSVKGLTM